MFINDILSSIMLTLNSTLGKPNFKPLDQIMTGGYVKLIKSIQRGYTESSKVTISNVNPDKCIVLLNPTSYTTYNTTDYSGGQDGNYYAYGWAYNGWSALKTLTATNFTVDYNKPYSWQIIEFY